VGDERPAGPRQASGQPDEGRLRVVDGGAGEEVLHDGGQEGRRPHADQHDPVATVRPGDQPHDEDLMRESTAAFQALVDAIVALQRNGTVRKDDPVQLARFIWAAVHGVSMLIIDGQLSHQQTSIDELIEFAVERINTGIARPARQNDR